jgi:hypothetical protein
MDGGTVLYCLSAESMRLTEVFGCAAHLPFKAFATGELLHRKDWRQKLKRVPRGSWNGPEAAVKSVAGRINHGIE